MTIADAGLISDRAVPLQAIDALRSLRRAVSKGGCRIGRDGDVEIPCLLRLIMEIVPHGMERDRLVEAIADSLPGDRSERPQMRMMRYCRTEGASRKVVLRAIEGVMMRSDCGLMRLPLGLWARRLRPKRR